MSRAKADTPFFWIIAGPNGSGKTTVYEETILRKGGRNFWIINPDTLALNIYRAEFNGRKKQKRAANLQAVKRIYAWLKISIESYQTIGVETVLSTAKYRRLVRLARDLGFRVHLIYVILPSPQACLNRVQLRVKKGGHTVPKEKVVERYERSLKQLPWFIDAADYAAIYDNSSRQPTKMAEKAKGTLSVYPSAFPAIVEAAQRAAKIKK